MRQFQMIQPKQMQNRRVEVVDVDSHIGRIDRIHRSAEPAVKFIVRPDPRPFDRVPIALAHRSELIVDPHRPDILVALQPLESKRRMVRVCREGLISPSCRFFHPPVGNLRQRSLDELLNLAMPAFRKQLNVAADATCERCVCTLKTNLRAQLW